MPLFQGKPTQTQCPATSNIYHIRTLIISSMNRLSLLSQQITAPPPTNKVLIDKSQGKGTIWLNSPKDLNCLSISMGKALNEALRVLDDDQEVKVILIRSKHPKVFCAGADIKHMNENDYSRYPHKMHFLSFERTFRHLRKPVIAVVEGKALGGGFQIALLSDIILASEKAAFALPEITLGLIPGIGGTQNLTRVVGTKVAMKMILSGEPITAQEAHRLRIASLLPVSTFQQDVQGFADQVVNRSIDSLEAAKREIRFSQESTLASGLAHDEAISQTMTTTKGAVEGVTAYLEKRKPDYRSL